MDKTINVYEVIRVINSKPLFLYEHFVRFVNSVKFLGIETICEKEFCNSLNEFIIKNEIAEGNIRIDTYISEYKKECRINIRQVPHKYPSEEQYRDGVLASLYLHQRENPQKKIWDAETRQKVDSLLKSSDDYEVIYYNEEKYITEGSRSNIFFISKHILYTTKSKHVLKGVTRTKIIELASNLGIDFLEKNIKFNELDNYDAAFISGTSPKILPLRKIDRYQFDVNDEVLRLLMVEFNKLVDSNIGEYKTCG